ncbi:MAG TPA: chitinase [Cyanobacteria bacterium UBA11372]|nr:chitinase [Cyanobacteria bacterium UBA11372]
MAYKLVGYYENWAQYRPEGKGKFLPDQIDPSLLTHINFAFGFFGFITKSVDPKNPRLTGNYKIEPVEWNDQTVLYPALQKLKQKNPNLKTLLSIGGWSFNDPQDTNGIGTFTYKLFSQMASSAAGRKEFIDSAIAYAHKYGFDGIDLDWEYPGDRARGGTDSDFDNFLALLKEFRSAINNDKGQKLLLTIASPAIKKGEAKTSEQFFAWLAQCAGYLDWLNVMSYDYHGAFPDDKVTGVNAPLLQDSTPGGTFSVRHTVEAYLNGGIPKEKMVLGMPTYGRTFKVTSPLTDTDNGPGKPYSGPGGAGKATQTPGFLAYYEILERLSSGDLKQGWDNATHTPYAYSKNGEWVSYDDSESLAYKVSYLIEKDLAGAMIWAIDDDKFF